MAASRNPELYLSGGSTDGVPIAEQNRSPTEMESDPMRPHKHAKLLALDLEAAGSH